MKNSWSTCITRLALILVLFLIVPVAVQANDYTITLKPGWNFISTPKILDSGNNTPVIFKDVNTSGRSMWQYDAQAQHWKAMNASTRVTMLDGIWIYSNTTIDVPLFFSQDPPTTPPAKQVSAGWNAIGFSDSVPCSAYSALISVDHNWTQVTGYNATAQGYEVSIVRGGTGIHSISREMLPAQGYWLNMSGNGVLAACGGCADSDGDGLSNAWEVAGFADVNYNGVKDAGDADLPGANLSRPDVYVQYDWMNWSAPGNACDSSADCTAWGPGHDGETCTGPKVIATKAGSCGYACTVDANCTTRSPGDHTHERCISNVCQHTHDPEVLAPGALQAVADSFAAHGINLHIIRGQELPHSIVTSFRRNSEMQDVCEGGSSYSGSAGLGKYAVSLYDLKAMSALDKLNMTYHYALFGHYSACDTTAHCGACPSATNPDGSPKGEPLAGESGLAEISGNDFIVSLGNHLQDSGYEPGIFNIGSTFMHELGHNFGIHHGGGIDTPCTTDAECPGGTPGSCSATAVGTYCQYSDDIPYKTNYLSIMNYGYQWTGIISAAPDGSNSPITCESDGDCAAPNHCNLVSPPGFCARLDFSNEVLPRGGNTPGVLDQTNLNEQAGLGSLRTPDLFYFTDLMGGLAEATQSAARTVGPVDWDGDGDYDNDHVRADTRCGIEYHCSEPQITRLAGHADWGPAAQSNFTYKFQYTPYAGD